MMRYVSYKKNKERYVNQVMPMKALRRISWLLLRKNKNIRQRLNHQTYYKIDYFLRSKSL